jgi:hypothetical protein
MPTPTYTPLATVTLGTAASSVTFSSIPATYRDLILVVSAPTTTTPSLQFVRFNGDTGFNYNTVVAEGFPTSTGSQAYSSRTNFNLNRTTESSTTIPSIYSIQLMDYSATDKHKTGLIRTADFGSGKEGATMWAGRWADTSAISSIVFAVTTSFDANSTFSLYGVIS